MRLPNGFGSVTKMTGKRRRPWRAVKTNGWSVKNGKTVQDRFTLGYYATKQEAITALANFNEDPYDVKKETMTFSDLYEKCCKEYFTDKSENVLRHLNLAYRRSEALWKIRVKDIRVYHLENTINNSGLTDSPKFQMKMLYNAMFRYAVKLDVVDKDYAAMCDPVKQAVTKIIREPFSKQEIDILWENKDFPFVDMVLIAIYSGWRPQELALLELKNVNLKEGTMFGGLKTEAGKNRFVPIHSKILPLVKENVKRAMELKSEFLFNNPEGTKGTELDYHRYAYRLKHINRKFGFSHKPHDTRHTFITMAKHANMDEYILKLIVGHSIQDVTEKVYTHRTMEQLKKEIEKIQ